MFMGGQLLSRQLHRRPRLPVACLFMAHRDTARVSIFISYPAALICLEYLLDRET